MRFILPKTPWILKKTFSSFVWDLANGEKTLYLTFDDGPTPEITEQTLQILENFDAKATFFCIGQNVKEHPSIFQKVLEGGHSIGNHTYHHLKGWETDNREYLENTLMAEEIILETSALHSMSNHQPKLFRPPYGRIGPLQGKMLQKLGYRIIMWDVVSIDWEPEITPQVCLNNVLENAKEGSIVVFHDSVKASKKLLYALPKTLEFFSERGFEFKAITADTLALAQ